MYIYIYILSHNFLVTFATNAGTWFFDITCFQQLKLVSDSKSQYLHVQNKECEEFRFVSKHVRFLCISHEFDTYKLFIDPVTCVLIAKEWSYIRSNTSTILVRTYQGQYWLRKCFLCTLLLKVQSCRYFSDLFIIHDGNTSFINSERKYILN
jgi:hypothetical protein